MNGELSTGQWVIGGLATLASVIGVVVSALLSGVRSVQTALWAAVNECRRDIARVDREVGQLSGRVNEHHKRHGGD
jgi:hypothetical protein